MIWEALELLDVLWKEVKHFIPDTARRDMANKWYDKLLEYDSEASGAGVTELEKDGGINQELDT